VFSSFNDLCAWTERRVIMSADTLWSSPPRRQQEKAEIIRRKLESNESLIQTAREFNIQKIAEELKKYDSSGETLKAIDLVLP